MPRYRIILEFDHPGDGQPIGEHSTTNSPAQWNFRLLLPDDISLFHKVEVYEQTKPEWKLIRS